MSGEIVGVALDEAPRYRPGGAAPASGSRRSYGSVATLIVPGRCRTRRPPIQGVHAVDRDEPSPASRPAASAPSGRTRIAAKRRILGQARVRQIGVALEEKQAFISGGASPDACGPPREKGCASRVWSA